MKKKCFIPGVVAIILCFLSGQVAAQNIGIGNNNPGFKLDLSGRLKIRGGQGSIASAGIWLGGINADSAVNKAFIGMSNDSIVGFYGELGAGWALNMNAIDGRVGIRNENPSYPLSFDDQSGDKISLYRDNNGNYYGLGVGNSTMQLMTPNNNGDILFGYGKSNNFTENMRMKGNGFLGIGVNDPIFRLDVKDRMRIRSGGDANTSPGLYLNNLDNTSIASFIGMQANNLVGLYGSGGVWGLTMNTDNGNIGIRNTNANAPLQFANDIRQRKLVLYETADNDHQFYGFGVTSSVLRYQTATTADDHVFYAGNGTAASNELVRIKGNGNVGLGVTDPVFKLDVGGRIRLRATPGNSSGLWLNNNANNASPAFIGMQSDNQVGFFGSGTGWGLSMNTQNGAISVAGSAGQPGQVLTSNGSSGSATWSSPGIYSILNQTFGAAIVPVNSEVDIPNLTTTITLTSNAQVVINFKIRWRSDYCVICPSDVYVRGYLRTVGGFPPIITQIDGGGNAFPYVSNTMVSGPIILELGPGTYTYKISLFNLSYALPLEADLSELTWQIFPR